MISAKPTENFAGITIDGDHDEFKHNFYDNLSIAMERKNMNCKALSRAIHKNDGYISRIMSGKIEPSFSMIYYIAEALGIEPKELF